MTQKFVDYLKENPRKTSNQFYEDVLGYSRPRAHNNMFFAAIKDAGILISVLISFYPRDCKY